MGIYGYLWVFMGTFMGMILNTDSLEITPEVLSLIAGLDEFKGAWKALGTLAPERLSALRRVATIESVGSSTRIEGVKLSDKEVAQLLSNIEINVDGNTASAKSYSEPTRPGLERSLYATSV